MKIEAWKKVLKELDLWSDRGLRARFWLRDDDACDMSPQLARLFDLASQYKLNIGLAVIPGKLNPGFVDMLADMKERFHPMCHGWIHADYGRFGEPGEFGRDRPLSSLRSDAEQAYKAFSQSFGTGKAIFVPPFGRITSGLVKALPQIGFAGISTGPSYIELKILRMNSAMPWMPVIPIPKGSEIRRFDVHIDVLEWQRKTARDSEAIATNIVENLRVRRRGFITPRHPIGLLTHHLVHDEHVWQLCNEILCSLSAHEAVEFMNADCLFEEDRQRLSAPSPSVGISSTRGH